MQLDVLSRGKEAISVKMVYECRTLVYIINYRGPYSSARQHN